MSIVIDGLGLIRDPALGRQLTVSFQTGARHWGPA